MNQTNQNNFNFNTNPLLLEINNIIQDGMNNLLNDFITNYKLYEETHNCIMNLPSIKREINKINQNEEIYDDLPDLISASSNDESSEYYNRLPVHNNLEDSDQESDDTMLCMKKIANQLFKEKEEINAFFQQEKKSYEEIINNCNKEISDLKGNINLLLEDNNKKYTLFYKQKELYENTIEKFNKEIEDLKHQLSGCVQQPVVYDLTSEEFIVEIKKEKEKENIILHIEEKESVDDSESESEDDVEVSESEDKVESDSEVDETEDKVEDDVEVCESEDKVESNESEEKVEANESEEEVETEDDESESEDKVEEEEEEELFEIEIDDKTYCTNNEENGFIYELDENGDVGEVIGYLKEGEPFFN